MKEEEMIKKAEEFMLDSFQGQNVPSVIADGMIRHLIQTRRFVLLLTEGTQRNTVPLEIAALLHGVERGYRGSGKYKRLLKGKKHEEKSAIITEKFMKKKKYPKTIIKKTVSLIEKHEEAPTQESKLLRDADNLSFLKNTLPIWFEARLWAGEKREKIIEESKKIIEKKFNEIDSENAKKIAKKFKKKWDDWLLQKEEA